MIWGPDGQEWGTAEQIAARLTPIRGGRITAGMVRRWHDRHDLPKARMRDPHGRREVRYQLTAAAAIEAATRDTSRGRPRQLDTAYIAA